MADGTDWSRILCGACLLTFSCISEGHGTNEYEAPEVVDVAQLPDSSRRDAGLAPADVLPDTANLPDQARDSPWPADVLLDDVGELELPAWHDSSGDMNSAHADMEVPPAACPEGTACNQFPAQDGACPGTCIEQQMHMTCQGAVVNTICNGKDFTGQTNKEAWAEGLHLAVTQVPKSAVVGQAYSVAVSVENETSDYLILPLAHQMGKNWELASASFEAIDQVEVAPGGQELLVAQVKAVGSTLLSYDFEILTMFIGGTKFPVFVEEINWPEEVGVDCAGKTYHGGTSSCSWEGCEVDPGYYKGFCCNDVFYPDIECCTTDDCQMGACFDGKCVYKVPFFGSANTMAAGYMRILYVLVDVADSGPLCENKFDTAPFQTALTLFEEYFKQVVVKRTGIDYLGLDWYVVSGLASSEFYGGSMTDFNKYADALEQYLQENDCVDAQFDQFDKIVIASPLLDFGNHTGMAYSFGRIGLNDQYDPYILAHEFAHTCGGSDLYYGFGAGYQYKYALMSTNLGAQGTPTDTVMWGQMGLGDWDFNGILDVAEYAYSPEALVLGGAEAEFQFDGVLRVTPVILGAEEGADKKLFTHYPGYMVHLPGHSVSKEMMSSGLAFFDADSFDTSVLEVGEALTVRVTGTHTFTDKYFQRQTLALDQSINTTIAEAN